MKTKVLVVIIFAISIKVSIAQPYESIFGEYNTSWNVTNSELFGVFTDSLVVDGDTLINGFIYKKIKFYNIYAPNYPPEQMDYTSFIREDTLTGQVWYLKDCYDDSTEILIMDLNLQLNDSFYMFGGYNFGYYQVDSIYYLYNKKHIQFNCLIYVVQPPEKFLFIEGVGTNRGITYLDACIFDGSSYLLCSYKNYDIYYQNQHPYYQGHCNTFFTDYKITREDGLPFIYPNPVNDILIIDIQDGDYKDKNIKIVDVMGNIIYQIYIQNTAKIDISHLPDGIYFVSVQSDNNHFQKKIIKMKP